MNDTHHHIGKGKKITPLIFLKEKDHMTANDTTMVAINTAKNASIVLQEEKNEAVIRKNTIQSHLSVLLNSS
jgi:hypothetical protein